MSDKSLQVAFLLSVSVHTLFLGALSGIRARAPETEIPEIEVTYIEIEEEFEDATKPFADAIENIKMTMKEEMPESAPEEAPVPAEPERSVEKKETQENPSEEELIEESEKELMQQRTIEWMRSRADYMTSDMAYMEGSSDSLNYLNAVRNKINRYVQEHYHPSMGRGGAFVHFILYPNGAVKYARISKDNLRGNKRLKRLCLDGVYLSAPFEPFPESLDLPNAAFNINISFKKE